MEEFAKKITEAYRFIIKWFWALPVWKRAIFSSFIGAIGGSSIVGFFNRYALYWHALQQGFRVPVEGVEYLDLAISLLSFAFIFTSVVGSVLIYYIMDKVGDIVANILVNSKNVKGRTLAKRITVLIQGLAPLLAIIVKMTQDEYLTILFNPNGSTLSTWKAMALSMVSFISLLGIGYVLQNKESRKKTLTLVVVVIALLSITFSLFNQTVYSYFLYQIGFGGNRKVSIEYRTADNTKAIQHGYLLIKTAASVTVRQDGDLHEIPNERISKLSYTE